MRDFKRLQNDPPSGISGAVRILGGDYLERHSLMVERKSF